MEVPFVLIEGSFWPWAGYVAVNLDKSTQPLPLTTVYHQLRPVQASSYTIFQAIFGHGYPVGLLDEEKILPLGKEITAVGICRLQDGVPEIESCKDLPYFLPNKRKDQMEVDLGMSTNILFWGGVLLSTLSFGILGYSIHDRPPTDATAEVNPEDESGDVPEGELCIICLMSRRRSAFVPCGHLAVHMDFHENIRRLSRGLLDCSVLEFLVKTRDSFRLFLGRYVLLQTLTYESPAVVRREDSVRAVQITDLMAA
ncbi:hypothetical protein ACLOJK_022734, partial [Asimina triloba]